MKASFLLIPALLLPLSCLSVDYRENRESTLLYRIGIAGEGAERICGELSEQFPSPANQSCRFHFLPIPEDEALRSKPGEAPLFCDEIFTGTAASTESVRDTLKQKYGVGRSPKTVTLFTNGSEGFDVFRIPSVVTLAPNQLTAFAEARGTGKTDCVENKIVCKTTIDGGRHWSPLILVADSGEASLNNPTPVYLPESNTLLVLFQQYPPKRNETTTAAGLESDSVCRTLVAVSSNGGLSWSQPTDITRQVKKEEMSAVACGPGQAIVLQTGPFKGRIVVPFASTGMDAGWYNYLVFSDDNGTTWHMSDTHSAYGTNESTVVQIGETELLVSARNHRFAGDGFTAPIGWNPWNTAATSKFRAFYRVQMTDTGFQWSAPMADPFFPDPRCQGSLLKDSEGILYLSNASNTHHFKAADTGLRSPHPTRVNGCVSVSNDSGRRWQVKKRIYGNRWTGFQYSVLTEVNPECIGCIFEAWPEIKWMLLDKKWLQAE